MAIYSQYNNSPLLKSFLTALDNINYRKTWDSTASSFIDGTGFDDAGSQIGLIII